MAKALDLKSTKGVLVSKVQKDSPAEEVGLQEEDVIISFNDKELDNATELSTWVASTSPDQKINLKILRNGNEKSIIVKLGELNEEKQALAQGKSQYTDLGIQVANIVPELIKQYHLYKGESGVVVTKANPNSVAAGVGIREGDVIIKVNRRTIKSVDDFDEEIAKVDAGENLLFYLRRGSANLFVAFAKPDK